MGADDEKKPQEHKDWLFLIPVQVGPATPYARNVKSWMHLIIIIQAVVCVSRFAVLHDFSGGLWMALVISLGYYAILQGMNITYICCWGALCAVNGVFDVLGFIVPSIIGLLKFNFLSTFVRVSVPLSYLAGALFAWHLYLDYEQHLGHEVSKFDPMAKYSDNFDCEEQTPLQAAGDCVHHVFGSTNALGRSIMNKGATLQGAAAAPPEPEEKKAKEAEEKEPPRFPKPCC
mmetsp:Transcript_53284/g.155220  ORF Transcript_53284/g.155220 Transcript_53284/m.155220 type:complete len:231 (-) Transcript_53284:80-772(-)